MQVNLIGDQGHGCGCPCRRHERHEQAHDTWLGGGQCQHREERHQDGEEILPNPVAQCSERVLAVLLSLRIGRWRGSEQGTLHQRTLDDALGGWR